MDLKEKILNYADEIGLKTEVQEFLKYNNLIAIRGEVFVIDENFNDLINQFYLKTIYVGKKIGRIGIKFFPNIGFFEEVFKYAPKEKIQELPYKKSWLMCCGRDLFLKDKNKYFFTYNNRFIAFGLYDSKRRLIKNLFDIGMYVRNQAKL